MPVDYFKRARVFQALTENSRASTEELIAMIKDPECPKGRIAQWRRDFGRPGGIVLNDLAKGIDNDNWRWLDMEAHSMEVSLPDALNLILTDARLDQKEAEK